MITDTDTDTRRLTIGGLTVEVARKDIKNWRLGVYPPHGRAPLGVSDDAVRLAVIGKLGWIKRRQAAFDAPPRQARREMIDGESHYVLGRRYRLRVPEHAGPARVAPRGRTSLDLFVRPGSTRDQRAAVLRRWYRDQLEALLPPLLEEWQARLGVRVSEWGVKRMKTNASGE